MSADDEINFRDLSGFAKGKELPWVVLRSHAQEVLEGLARAGLTPHPSSRIARYVSLLENPPVVDERTLYRFLHYRIDVRMLRTIVRRIHDISEFQPLLAGLISGPELRQRREKGSARDFQFQLYVAAVLRRAASRFVMSNPMSA
jgi:hypothetical protein